MIPSLIKVILQLCGRVCSFHLNVGKSPRHLTLHWKCHPEWDCNMLSSGRKPHYQKHLLNNVPEKRVASSLSCERVFMTAYMVLYRTQRQKSLFLRAEPFFPKWTVKSQGDPSIKGDFLACLLYEVLRTEPTASHMLHSSPALSCAPSWRMFMQIIKRLTVESFKALPARPLHFCGCCCYSTYGDIYKRGTSATKILKLGAGETAGWLKALATLVDDCQTLASTWWLTIMHKYVGSNFLF